MKKIMLAMMATVGLAFFAKADGTTYTGSTYFEGEEFVVGNGLPETDYGTSEERSAFWVNYQDAVGESKIVAGGLNESTKYASLDTGNQVLLRQAEPGYTKDFGSIYFDTMVQFTASEGDPAVSTTDGDKLVIWLQSNEAVGTKGEDDYVAASTNLMIRAAKLNTIDYHKTGSQDYTVVSDTPFEAGKWYWLTVKTYADISGLEGVSCPGFEVYIGGTKVSVTGADLYKGYFASLVDWDSVGAGELTGIGFQGTGAVDDIVMTSEDPIPPVEVDTVKLTVDLDEMAGDYVEDLTYTVNEGDSELYSEPTDVAANEGDTITLGFWVSDGFSVKVGDGALQPSGDKDEGDRYPYTYTVTVTAEMIENGLTLAISVTEEGETPVVPETAETIPGTPVQVKAIDLKAAVEAVTVQGVNGTVYAASQKYYTKTAVETGTEGVFEVTVTLNGTALEEDVDAAVEAALEAVAAGATSVELPAGFYYKVESGSGLPIATTATGTTNGSKIEIKGLTEAAGFFKVSVGTTEFAE